MLPLVFDDTSAKRGNKKNDDDAVNNANNNANNNRNDKDDNEDDDGFRINEKDKEEMPLKDVVVITIFHHWFDIAIDAKMDMTEKQNDLALKLKNNLKEKLKK